MAVLLNQGLRQCHLIWQADPQRLAARQTFDDQIPQLIKVPLFNRTIADAGDSKSHAFVQLNISTTVKCTPAVGLQCTVKKAFYVRKLYMWDVAQDQNRAAG